MHNNDWHYDVPADLPLESCVQGDKWNIEEHDGGGFWHRASTSFDIPVSADNIFLLSRGWLSAGLVEIKTSADQSKETVTFDIVAEYHREYIRNLAKACVASREGNQHGVGIFVSQRFENGFKRIITLKLCRHRAGVVADTLMDAKTE